MMRAPAVISPTDFKGSEAPRENGRTISLKLPNDELPVQPGGVTARAGVATSKTILIAELNFFTNLRRVQAAKSLQPSVSLLAYFVEHPTVTNLLR